MISEETRAYYDLKKRNDVCLVMCLRNLWSQRLRPEALYWALGSSMNWRPAISLFLDVTAPIS